jgi:hypothetical protein
VDSKSVIKIVLILGGAYIIYDYLQSSGLWTQWFGAPAAAPTATTTTTAPAVTAPTSTSAALPLAATPVAASSTSALTTGSLSYGGVTTAQLDAWMQQAIGTTLAGFDQWCYAMNALVSSFTCPGTVFTGFDRSTPMTSYVFLSSLQNYQTTGQMGPGLGGFSGFAAVTPYAWGEGWLQ